MNALIRRETMGRINKSDQKREEILEHVYEIISTEGVEGATFSRIAERAGIHKSQLTYYFNTKGAMIVSLVDLITDKYIERFYEMVASVTDPRARLEKSLDVIFSRQWVRIIDYRVFYSCFYLGLVNEQVRARFKAMYDRLKEILVEELKTHMARGTVTIDDPETTAVFIIIQLEGFDYYLAVSGYDKKTEQYGRYLKQHLIHVLGVRQTTET
jgi:AcrR family transcriptional regulator